MDHLWKWWGDEWKRLRTSRAAELHPAVTFECFAAGGVDARGAFDEGSLSVAGSRATWKGVPRQRFHEQGIEHLFWGESGPFL
jgi:hypothetical protein